ncbi:MAG: leucine-rich repeat protein [Prevotella sp.]|nr:leucine-rich repeat protein [Prevotella sp.]
MACRLLTTLVSWILTLQVMAQYDLYVSLLEDGTLEETVELITEKAHYSVRSMKVNGPINGTDMMFIRDMCGVRDLDTPTDGQLRILDLTDAYVVESPAVYLSMYGVDYTTQDSHFGSGFLYNCQQLEEVFLPMGINSIDTLAFAMCSSLKEMMIPDGVTHIGYGAFYGCSNLHYLSIPDFVSDVEEGAFQYMDNLEELSLGDAVASLDNAAILGDKRLQIINLGNRFKDYSPVMFYNAPSLSYVNVTPGNPYYCSLDGVLFSFSKDSLMVFPPVSPLTNYEVPEEVRHISPYAFCNASKLRSVVMPDSMQVIDTLAFYGCSSLSDIQLNEGLKALRLGAFANTVGEASSLAEISLPSTVDEIDGGAFLFQTANIRVSEQNEHYASDDSGILYDKEKTVVCHVPCVISQLELAQTVDSVAPYAFAGTSVPVVYLCDQVKHIGNGAFLCATTHQITLGYGIEDIGEWIVDGCAQLKSLYCFASPKDNLMAAEAFYDHSGNVGRQCVLYVLPGNTNVFMQKKGFADADGNSYFSAVREMDGADDIRTAERHGASSGLVYDLKGQVIPTSQKGVRIVVLPDGKGIKTIER